METHRTAFTAVELEAQRLLAVRATHLLDTPAEEAYDDLVQLAASICDAPISLITLVDQDRQWFKARFGVETAATSRDISFCSIAIQQDGYFVVPDLREDPRFAANPLVTGEHQLRFYASYPLSNETGDKLGTLCVLDRIPRSLTSSQQNALRVLAGQVMTQIDLRMQLRALDQVLQERECVARELEVTETRFRAFMDASPAATFIKDAEGKMMYCNRAITEPHGAKPADWIGLKDHEVWPEPFASRWREADLKVLREGKLLHFNDETPRKDLGPLHWNMFRFPFEDARGATFLACVAVDVTREREIEIELHRYQEELQQANRDLTDLAVTDELTQVKNRRAFDEALAYEFARSKRSHTPLSLLLLDIDCFKSFNDTFGHVRGDGVLRSVAALIKGSVRGTDVVARYGGEEFVVILPDASEGEAFHLASRICEIVEEAEWELRPITISIGVGTLQTGVANSVEFVESVDRALYAAKRRGKNQASLPCVKELLAM